jgi:TRAP-type C4-dicarboxylate transport system substrate-binding protein
MNEEIFKPWFAELEKRSGGRVKVEAHYAGELVPVPEAYDAVVKGTVDIAHVITSHFAQFFTSNVFNLPTFDNYGWRPSRIYLELYQQFPGVQAEYSAVKPTILMCMFINHLGTTKKPVRKLEDVQGLKMIAGGKLANDRAQGLGMVPVSCTPPETYSFLEKGVADGGTFVTMPELFTYRWGDVLKYITVIPMARPPQSVIMNLDKFNSLPADIQKMIDDMMAEFADVADESQARGYNDAVARAPQELGTEFIKLSPEEIARWVEADRPVINTFIADLDAKGIPGKQFYDVYQQLEKKYSAPEYEFK